MQSSSDIQPAGGDDHDHEGIVDMQSSSIRSEIQPAGDDDHDQVLSTPNEEQLENNSWQREMESLEKLITKHCTDVDKLNIAFQKLKTAGKGEVSELRKMKKLVMYWKDRASVTPSTDLNFSMDIKNNNILDNNHRFDIPSEKFQEDSFKKYYGARYHELGTELKLCLLCLAAFPKNAKIKRRVLVQWWIGEGFVHELDKKTAEEWGDLYFDELIHRGFLEPDGERNGPSMHTSRFFLEPDDEGKFASVKTCRMHPLVYSLIVELAADEKFFDIDHRSSLRLCLKVGKGLTDLQDLKKLNTLFNVDETLLTLNPDWFLKMTNARVLHLGSWQATETHQIDVMTKRSMNKKYVNALDGLENVTKLRLLNLERFSWISKLFSNISKLTDLTILNLRACHHLEFLPDGIGCLVNLTHLDMSDCYLLEHMPKGISQLTKIQVLKGFVVKNTDGIATCTLWDLRGCKELRKLGLHIKQDGFPSDDELRSLNSLGALIKLNITWGIADTGPPHQTGIAMQKALLDRLEHELQVLPPRLKLLELECLPFTSLPIWLQPSNLPASLKKLCVTGGNLSEIHVHGDGWRIEELHLKYMKDLDTKWDNLRKQMPNLKYLKKVDCPKLSDFLCDENGVWIL